MRRRLGLALVALLAVITACARVPVSDEVTIDFADSRDGDLVSVTVQTDFLSQPANSAMRTRIDTARDAAVAGTDAWSARFARLSPESERLTFDRSRGTLDRVTRAVRIPADDLQRIFSDMNVTVSLVRGDGWRELTLYPGTSSRATREQRREFEEALSAWSGDVAHYFNAVQHLYSYLDKHSDRARYVFAAVLDEKDEAGNDPMVTEDEQPLVENVRHAMETLADKLDASEGRATTFAEEADLVYNPFPARIVIHAPDKQELTIEPVDLFAGIAALEGRWIQPDPLAAVLRDDKITSEQLAHAERHANVIVSATEVEDAVRAQLVRPKQYSLRWPD
ncbi:MAG: hypothetical protein JO197_03570 [Acidobacteria bacterium]|nr:hypothetical protein [Acidobacteriota bacterium]MBV9476537.1 hypothetical protein [Acidobacteriota bacterium]